MKLPIALLVTLSLAGCASAEQRRWEHWQAITEGESRESVIESMGQPDIIDKSATDGKPVIGWGMNAYTACGLALDDAGKVVRKNCREDAQARQAYSAEMQSRAQMFMQMNQAQQAARPAYTPIQPYRMQTPTQTHCTSNSVGGYVNTNCSSY